MVAVKYLRQGGLKYREVSEITGIGEQNLRLWDKGYDEELRREREDLRGHSFQMTEGFIEFIVGAAREFLSQQKRRKRLRIKPLLRYLNKVHREQVAFFGCGKSRRVITEILVANGLYEERLSKRKYPGYKPRLSRYCPNAQLVIDGKKLAIEFMGERFRFNLEMAKDMLSEAITGHSLTDEEDAQAVWEVLEQHTRRYGDPIALLLDNNKANYKVVAEKLEGIISIFAFKGCPETKAVLEGEFGNLEREFGSVKINGGDKRELAKGILKAMVALYVSLRNQKPRCSVCSRTPLKLMEEGPNQAELERAKERLKERQERSLALKEDPCAKPEKLSLIEDILTRAGLYVEDRERFFKTLLKYDEKVIRDAEADFFAMSQRDSFSETKRTGQYFVGIVRNKQIELDRERKKELYRKRYSLDQQWQEKRESYRRRQEGLKEEETLKRYPERALLDWITSAFNLNKAIGYQSGFFMDKIKEALEALVRKHNFKERVVQLVDNIMAIRDWAIEKRLEVVSKVQQWSDQASVQGVKSVTLKV
jgi:hypothetical protein